MKEIFCEFDKNEIHKERTFIFPLRSPNGTDDDFYIINYKDDLLRRSFGAYDHVSVDDDYIFEDFYKGDYDYDYDEYDYNKDYDDIKSMFLHGNTNKDEKDERKSKYYSIVLDESLHGGGEEYKL